MVPEIKTFEEARRTLGSAFLAGLKPYAECRRGKRSGPVKIVPCGYRSELHLETLIWTRGAKYPCARLAQRLKCPRCGGLAVTLVWMPSDNPKERAQRDLYQCVVAVNGW